MGREPVFKLADPVVLFGPAAPQTPTYLRTV